MAEFKDKPVASERLYPQHIRKALAEMLGLNELEPKEDIARLYTLNEILDAVLEYEGISGYGNRIRQWIFEIYGIDLSKAE